MAKLAEWPRSRTRRWRIGAAAEGERCFNLRYYPSRDSPPFRSPKGKRILKRISQMRGRGGSSPWKPDAVGRRLRRV
ncbi:hypothetical protein TNCV_4718131 [Trichonephila clavipes]|nr:hypothetical protein TNCV_4718131 [Trichonephila clavipes]